MTQIIQTDATQANWKNPGNWHWVEKNTLPWTTEYLKERILKFENVRKMEVKGDANVCMRKGKVLYIFDLECEINWEVKNGEDTFKGAIKFPEAMHDMDPKKYERHITVEGSHANNQAVLKSIEERLLEDIFDVFRTYRVDLESVHGPGLIVKDTHSSPLTAHLDAPKQVSSTSGTKTQYSGKKVESTTKVQVSSTFRASGADSFSIFTDENKIRAWTRDAGAKFSGIAGSDYAILSGAITGTIKSINPSTELCLTWRHRSWSSGVNSTVKITFAEDASEGQTKIDVVHTGVPSSEEDSVRKNWEQYYFIPMKQTFGLEMFI